MALPPLENYAYPLLPADAAHTALVVEAPENWSLNTAPDGADVVLWGRVPYRRPPSPATLIRHVASRERALRRLGRSHAVHRLSPPPGRTGRLRTRMRDFLLGGAVVELARARGVESVLDAIIRTSASTPIEGESFAPGADRAATLRVLEPSGRPGILRFGPSAGASDPAASAAVLRHLEKAGIQSVPRVLSDGRAGEASYVVETIVPGRRPARVSDELIARVVEFLAGLPRGERAPASVREDIEAIAVAVPQSAPDLLDLLERLRPHIESLPSILSHRDLWSGNILVDGTEFGGVIDWDGAHLYGVPGSDVLHLFVSRRRERGGPDIGSVWLEKPWRSQTFGRLTAPYWNALGIQPRSLLLDAIGIAWWLGWLRQLIARHERLLADEPWLAANMSSVLKESLLLL